MAQLQSQHNNEEALKTIREQVTGTLTRLKGRIRKMRQDKGFGFIAGDDGVDYFFHWSTVRQSSTRDFRALQLRDRVEFSPVQPQGTGPRGIEVTFLPDEN
jgi:cold shock CspA family protein